MKKLLQKLGFKCTGFLFNIIFFIFEVLYEKYLQPYLKSETKDLLIRDNIKKVRKEAVNELLKNNNPDMAVHYISRMFNYNKKSSPRLENKEKL